jgi:hypothetical protein
MKRITLVLAILMLTVAAYSIAAEGEKAAKAAPAPKTVTGEVVDMGCYLGHGAMGEKHIGCATKCIAGGMPMGLLTKSGMLYLLTLDHENADPYNKLKDMAGQTVTVTGMEIARNGVKGIDVTDAKGAAAATK